MKLKNPFKLDPGGRVKNPRNPFPAKYQNNHTAACGLVIPTYVQHLDPNSFLKYEGKVWLRTEPVSSVPYTKLYHETNYYAIPYRIIWKWWDMFYTGVWEENTSNLPSWARPQTAKVVNIIASDLFLFLEYLYNNKSTYTDVHGVPAYLNLLRLLDMLGYGASARDFETANQRDKAATDAAPAGSFLKLHLPLASDILGSSDYNYWRSFAAFNPTYAFNLWNLAAYNSLFYYYYRNTQWDVRENYDGTGISNTAPSNVFPNGNPSWQLDNFNDTITVPASTDTQWSDARSGKMNTAAMLLYISAMYYAPYFRDRSSAIVPFLTAQSTNIRPDYVTNSTQIQGSFGMGKDSAVMDLDSTTNEPQLSALNMLKLFAYNRLQNLRSMTPKTYRDQYDSLFGISQRKCEHPQYLSTMTTDLDFSPVVATASSANAGKSSVLGQLGSVVTGKGYGKFKFHAKEHTIVMGVSAIIPKNDYSSDRINEFNTKVTRDDYYQPQYDALGLQPQFVSSIGLENLTGSGNSLSDPNTPLGYEPRYAEYKSRMNETHGSLQYGRSRRNWTTLKSSVALSSSGHWTSKPSRFYVNPHITDTIFPVAYTGASEHDPFIVTMQHNASVTQEKATLGVPGF